MEVKNILRLYSGVSSVTASCSLIVVMVAQQAQATRDEYFVQPHYSLHFDAGRPLVMDVRYSQHGLSCQLSLAVARKRRQFSPELPRRYVRRYFSRGYCELSRVGSMRIVSADRKAKKIYSLMPKDIMS